MNTRTAAKASPYDNEYFEMSCKTRLRDSGVHSGSVHSVDDSKFYI